ncbi:hypothetical protein Tco_0216248, partial [Tanacetum coccineum]
VMSTSAYVDSESITQADGAQSSRVPVPLPDDPYVAVKQAQLVDTQSKPEESPSEAEEYRSLYKTSSSPSPNLPGKKRYRGTSELILDTNIDEDKLGMEDTKDDEE